jgi:hypothetical protein
MRVVLNAGALPRVLALAVLKPDESTKHLPALGAARITTAPNAIQIAANVFDFAITVKADSEIAEDGTIAVNGAALAALTAGLPAEASVIITGGDVTIVSCGRGRYRLPQIPLGDLPAPLLLGDVIGEVTIKGENLLRLFMPLAVVCEDKTRYYLNGVLLQSVDADLVGVATDGRQLMRVATSADMFSAGHDLIVPLKAATMLRKLVSKTSPERVAEARKQAVVTALEWQDGGALQVYLAGDAADDVIAGEGHGRGQIAMAIELLRDLLEALEGARFVLDVRGRGDPMRIGVAGDRRVLAVQTPCVFHFRSDESVSHQTNKQEEQSQV